MREAILKKTEEFCEGEANLDGVEQLVSVGLETKLAVRSILVILLDCETRFGDRS